MPSLPRAERAAGEQSLQTLMPDNTGSYLVEPAAARVQSGRFTPESRPDRIFVSFGDHKETNAPW